MPLYSATSSAQQKQAFGKAPGRKCIVSTNIAETSLTIDGIVYVIDVGLVKRNFYNPRVRMEMLQVAPISKAAANQRAGRAGRTQPGKCFRLYTERAFEELMPESTPPATAYEDVTSVILMTKASGCVNLRNFDWIDPPPPETLFHGIQKLNEW
jgi:pre-mRNA-splicing factor ATP-dependent RNA helicase DHX15/PRP43